jgi:fibronectin type 3 domain-containing protein
MRARSRVFATVLCVHPGLLSPRRSRPRSRGAALLLTVLVVLSAATITAVLVQVAVQAAGGQQRRLAYDLAFEQANTIERRVENVFAQDPLRVFDEVLEDEVPRVCAGDQVTYPSAFGAGSQWPASCGALWTYEGTANMAKGARIFPPSPVDPTWRIEVFAEVGAERVGFTRTFLVGGRDRPMLYSGGALDLTALSFTPTINGPVYAYGDVTLGSAVLPEGVLVASESAVLDPGSSLAATPSATGDGADLAVRAVRPAPLPTSMLVSSLGELRRVACRDASPSLVTLGSSTFATSLCLTAGRTLRDEYGVVKTFPSAGAYRAVLVVPESDARLRVFTRADVPAAWPGPLTEWTELGVFPLPGHGLVATDAVTVLGHCDETAGVCRDWDADSLPGSAINASFTLLVGSATSPADLYVAAPLRAALGRAGAVVSGVLRFPLEATPAATALSVDFSAAVLGRPGLVSVASSGTGSLPSLIWEGALLLSEFSINLDGFTAVSFTVPDESANTSPFLPAPGLLVRSDYARRIAKSDLDALFVLGQASGLSVPSAPGLLDLQESDSAMTLTWSVPTSDGGVGVSDYVVEYRESGATTWTVFADPTAASLSGSVTGLTNGLAYDFRVAAVNGIGQGPFSGTLTATPFVLPLAPTSVTLGLLTGSETSLELSWNAVTNVAIQGYNVYRQNLLSGLFELVATPTGTSHIDTGLTPGTSYTYKVAAFTTVGQGISAAPVTLATPELSPLTPVIVSTTRGNLTVTIGFTATSSTERPVEGFHFYVDGTLVASSSNASLDTYTFTGLNNGASPVLGVASFNTAGSSSSVTSSVTVIATPNAPTDLVVTPEIGITGSLAVSWSAPSNVIPAGFYVYRQNDLTGLYEVIATVTVASHIDDLLDAGTLYYYRVSAFIDTLEGGLSSIVSATAIDVPIDAVVLSSSISDLSVTLTFAVDEIIGRPVDGYRLLLDGVEVADIPAPAYEYEFTGLVDGFPYEFAVLGYNTAGDGLSDALLVTAVALPSQVTGLVVLPTSGSTTSLDLSWDEPVGSVSGFTVERVNALTGLYEVVATVTTTSYVDSALVSETSYTYRISAFNDAGAGSPSASVTTETSAE